MQEFANARGDGFRRDVGKFLLHSSSPVADEPDVTQRELRLRREEMREAALRKDPHDYVVERLGHVTAWCFVYKRKLTEDLAWLNNINRDLLARLGKNRELYSSVPHDVNEVGPVSRRVDKLTARFAQTARARCDAVYFVAAKAREDLRTLSITRSAE